MKLIYQAIKLRYLFSNLIKYGKMIYITITF